MTTPPAACSGCFTTFCLITHLLLKAHGPFCSNAGCICENCSDWRSGLPLEWFAPHTVSWTWLLWSRDSDLMALTFLWTTLLQIPLRLRVLSTQGVYRGFCAMVFLFLQMLWCISFCSVMSIPATVVYFTSYDRLKYAMGYKEGDPNTRFIPMLAGSSARGLLVPYFLVP